LSDMTALANTDGGDIVFGMRAEKGVAKDLVGLRNFVPDDRIGQLENLLRDFVQPRLPGLQIEARALSNGSHALLVRVGRSFAAPHMVRHQGVMRFCGRNSNGKYDLDVQQLRSAFLGSEGMADKLRSFRLDRINRLVSGGAQVKLTSEHLLALHILPVVSARPDLRLATGDFEKLQGESRPRPLAATGLSPYFNLDGLLFASSAGEEKHHSFVQLFRSGFLEAVESQLLAPRTFPGQDKESLIIPGSYMEVKILEVFPSYIKAMDALSLPPPYVASISLLNVSGYYMYVKHDHWAEPGRLVDRDHLLTDEVLIEDPTPPAHELLRPLFDQVWNGCGFARSINYDANGNWVQRG
jgi:hypothetical protein